MKNHNYSLSVTVYKFSNKMFRSWCQELLYFSVSKISGDIQNIFNQTKICWPFDADCWASECLDVKNNKWWLN